MKTNKKTFAQRAKELEKKFEGRNDKISMRTKEALMQQLRDEQEAVKAAMAPPAGDPIGQTPQLNQHFFGALLPMLGGAGATAATAGTTAAGAAQVAGAAPLPQAATEQEKGPGKFVDAAFSVVNSVDSLKGDKNFDTSGATAVDPNELNKQNTVQTIGKFGSSAKNFLKGDVVTGVTDLFAAGASIFGNRANKKRYAEANTNNVQMNSNKMGPSTYMTAYGGILDTEKPKWRPMPSDADPEFQDVKRTSWAKQQQMSPNQLGAFEDQRVDINNTTADRNAMFAQKWNEWKGGRTGSTPHNKYSMADPAYMAAQKQIWNDVYKAIPRTVNQGVQEYAQERSQMAYGGMLKPSAMQRTNQAAYGDLQKGQFGYNPFSQYKDSLGDLDINKTLYKGLDTYDAKPLTAADKFKQSTDPIVNSLQVPDLQSTGIFGKIKEGINKYGANALQYAPVIGGLTNKIKPPVTPRGTRLEGDVSLGRYDEKRLLNSITGGYNVAGEAKEQSGGNLAAYSAGANAKELNKLRALGEGYGNMANANLAQQEKETGFNEQRKAMNMQADLNFLEREAADKGAYNTAKAQNRADIFDNLGKIGREESNKKIIKEMYGYKWDGTYVRDEKGGIVKGDDGKPMTQAEYNKKKKGKKN